MNTKHYYKNALKMAWPSVLESFFISLAGMIDTMMVSAMGTYAVAAVGLTTQAKFIGLTAFFAINVAVSALVARRRGQEDEVGANEIFLTALVMSIILCLIISISMVYYAGPLMRISGSQSDTHAPATLYFKIITSGMIFNVIAMVINAAQRGSGNTKIAFVTNLTSSIVNIIFNYLLINGYYGFPKLGIKGAAIATVFGTFVAMVMSIRSLFHHSSYIRVKYIIKHHIRTQWQTVKSIVQFGSTMLVENLAMRVGFLTTAITAANLGTSSFAVHNAAMNIIRIGFALADGMQVAAVALTGYALGQGEREEAITYGHVCQRIGLVISVVVAIVFFFGGESIMGAFFSNPAEIEMGTILTRFMTVIILLQISQIIYGACLRAGGDVKYTLMAGIVSVTFIRTITTLTLVNIFQLGLIGIWIGIFSDQFSRYLFMRHRFKQGKWTEIAI